MTVHECILVAFGLADAGRLEEARAGLRRHPSCLETAEGLDLLARVELALGQEGEARRLWEDSSARGLGGRRTREALAALASPEWRHRNTIRRMRIMALALLLWGIAATSGFFAGLAWHASRSAASWHSSTMEKTP